MLKKIQARSAEELKEIIRDIPEEDLIVIVAHVTDHEIQCLNAMNMILNPSCSMETH